MSRAESVTAKQLLALLSVKHSKDVFVPECKTGTTHFGSHHRLDAWVMPRSWKHPDCTGYEIKVSRGDFLSDQKWPAYLDYCNELYFVTPPKLIDPAELPEGVGLVECTKNAARLLTKRKASRRDVTIPEDLFRYVLMARTDIRGEDVGRVRGRDFWELWLERKRKDKTLGFEVSRKIRELYEENVERVQIENGRLRSESEKLADVREALAELGIETVPSWGIRTQIRNAVAKMGGGLSVDHLRRLQQARDSLDRIVDELTPSEIEV